MQNILLYPCRGKIGRKLNFPLLCKSYQPWGNLYHNLTTRVLGKFGYKYCPISRLHTFNRKPCSEPCGFQSGLRFGYPATIFFLLNLCMYLNPLFSIGCNFFLCALMSIAVLVNWTLYSASLNSSGVLFWGDYCATLVSMQFKTWHLSQEFCAVTHGTMTCVSLLISMGNWVILDKASSLNAFHCRYHVIKG